MTEPRWTFPPELEPYRRVGDEAADDVVRAVFRAGGTTRVVELLGAIIDRRELPDTADWGPEYQTFRRDSLRLPEWYDQERADESVPWFDEHGWTALAILGCGSLPAGYAIPEVTQVLGTTQALAAHVDRRLWETAKFVVLVMEPDGIVATADGFADGPGARWTQKVRLFHAIIRFLLHPPLAAVGDDPAPDEPVPYGELLWERAWNPDHGTPIHQAHLAGTTLIFSLAILRGLRVLSYLPTPADPESARVEAAFLYRWNLIGHLLGLDGELMRWDYDSAEQLLLSFDPDTYPPDADRDHLRDSLVTYMRRKVPGWLPFLRPTAPILMHILLGERRAEGIGLELSRWQSAARPVMRGVMRSYGRMFRRSSSVRWFSRWLYRRYVEDLLGPQPGGNREPVRP